MRIPHYHHFQILTSTFLGFVSGLLIDFSRSVEWLLPGARTPHSVTWGVTLGLAVLSILVPTSLVLYVKPLSKKGAFMTGLCGYALIAIVIM